MKLLVTLHSERCIRAKVLHLQNQFILAAVSAESDNQKNAE